MNLALLQGIAFVVQGITTDSTGAPIPDVEVSVLALGVRVHTNQRGAFRLSLTAAGTYVVRLRRIGYRTTEIEVAATRPLVSLRPIVLHAVAEQLPDIAVEAELPTPTFYLRARSQVSARFFPFGPRYERWDPQGAALSGAAFLAVHHLPPGGSYLRLVGWYDSPSGKTSWHMVGLGGCPTADDLPVATAWSGLSDFLLLLDRSGTVWTQRIQDRNELGVCHRELSLGSSRTLLSAGPMFGGWVVATQDSGSSVHLTLYSSVGETLWDTIPPPFLRSRRALQRAHFTGTDLGATIASDSWPFEWTEVNASGGLRFTARPFTSPADSIRYAGWTAFPVLPIPNGFVQSLASPGALEGRIVLYNILGKRISVSQLAGAPAFVASDPPRRRLVGFRFSSAGRSRAEIVEYEY
ncbi:MAG TPA: carboxypeptidase-like regulatory domain-containing protein [Gemmatimonadales bacterium]